MLKNINWENFCLEYLRCGNAKIAYMAAFNMDNPKAASNSGSRLLKKQVIRDRLEELMQEVHNEKIADATELQILLSRIARQEQTEEVVVLEKVEKDISEARIINKKASSGEAIKAINLLAKLQGLDKDSSNVNILIPVVGGEAKLED